MHYFELARIDQQIILQQASEQLNISALAIEKDTWLCWLLEKLFSLPIKMVFKGGTSLSKGFNLIHRFSEDVDITIKE
ncbi:MAG: nucleotidyl transferase AbiEii/AbiGii toxin family protein [Coxiellaceae bacterium]|nr:nucleotidyl transferase AbiEii/AbiGii toxin family protein [Coxiellaceae bacterium]